MRSGRPTLNSESDLYLKNWSFMPTLSLFFQLHNAFNKYIRVELKNPFFEISSLTARRARARQDRHGLYILVEHGA